MKIAFISDIHGNIQAWRAVYEDLKALGVDRLICLGDIVGYGPQPRECLEAVGNVCEEIIIGNHEAAAASMLDLSMFNHNAQDMICWTANVIGDEWIETLGNLPAKLEFDAGGYPGLAVHGTVPDPLKFNYVLDESDARASLEGCNHRLMVLAHTHIGKANVLGLNGKMVSMPPLRLKMRADCRYVLNVGSVGMPRDGDPRACYGILDTVAQMFTWRRVAFDMNAFRDSIDSGPWNERRTGQMRAIFAHLWPVRTTASDGRTAVIN